MHLFQIVVFALILCCGAAAAENAAVPAGKPLLDPPTLRSLGGYWIIAGDDNQNATVEVAYRKAGSSAWKTGMAFFRVSRDATKVDGQLEIPANSWLFAGSIVLLDPDSPYEIKLTLTDPDGGSCSEVVTDRTIAEPLVDPSAPRLHVIPGSGGGSGTQNDPFQGLDAAQAAAKPGDVMLLQAGRYGPGFIITKSGEPGKPIVWQGAGDVIIGEGTVQAPSDRVIFVEKHHDVWFRNLTVAHAQFGLIANDCSRLVIQRCRFTDIRCRGITYCKNASGTTGGFFISDNVLEGASLWPRSKGIEDMNAIHGTGKGNNVCYNRISGFADGVDTFNSSACYSNDFHNNDISETTDDGIELDFTHRNNRCYFNRITNTHQGISLQPILGGPCYVFRNALYNINVEPFKMHNNPNGSVVLHNTIVKKGSANLVLTSKPVYTSFFRNNLFIGSDSGRPALDYDCQMINCDFDYSGLGFGKTGDMLKFNNVRYTSFADMVARAPIEKHATFVDPATVFASGILPPTDDNLQFSHSINDLRLKPGTTAIDTGCILENFSDGFVGQKPDVGAYEIGSELPHYGPRPEPANVQK